MLISFEKEVHLGAPIKEVKEMGVVDQLVLLQKEAGTKVVGAIAVSGKIIVAEEVDKIATTIDIDMFIPSQLKEQVRITINDFTHTIKDDSLFLKVDLEVSDPADLPTSFQVPDEAIVISPPLSPEEIIANFQKYQDQQKSEQVIIPPPPVSEEEEEINEDIVEPVLERAMEANPEPAFSMNPEPVVAEVTTPVVEDSVPEIKEEVIVPEIREKEPVMTPVEEQEEPLAQEPLVMIDTAVPTTSRPSLLGALFPTGKKVCYKYYSVGAQETYASIATFFNLTEDELKIVNQSKELAEGVLILIP